MGACASRPKDLDGPLPEEHSTEVPTPEVEQTQVDTTSEVVAESSEAKEEEPLVDISTPKAEDKVEESAIEAKVEEEIAALQATEEQEEEKPKEEEPSTGSIVEEVVVADQKPKQGEEATTQA